MTDRIEEVPGSARVVAKSDVLVVGGGPAGFAAAIAAKREGCSVTLIERYPYLGGLASGGMVLVLDDMHNGEEITVTGLCMEMIERMAKVGAAVYPPPEERGQSLEKYRKWSRWGCHDFRAQVKPQPIVFAAAFDPDGWKRVSNEKGLLERTIREASMRELGPTPFPAYAATTAGLRSITDEFVLAKFPAEDLAAEASRRNEEPDLVSEMLMLAQRFVASGDTDEESMRSIIGLLDELKNTGNTAHPDDAAPTGTSRPNAATTPSIGLYGLNRGKEEKPAWLL